jgi:hypothetical protein
MGLTSSTIGERAVVVVVSQHNARAVILEKLTFYFLYLYCLSVNRKLSKNDKKRCKVKNLKAIYA